LAKVPVAVVIAVTAKAKIRNALVNVMAQSPLFISVMSSRPEPTEGMERDGCYEQDALSRGTRVESGAQREHACFLAHCACGAFQWLV